MIQTGRAALEQRANDHDAVPECGLRQGLARWTRYRLGSVEPGVIFRLAGIRPGKQLLQRDDVRSGRGGFADSGHGPLDIAGLRGVRGHLHQRDHHRAGALAGRSRLAWFD